MSNTSKHKFVIMVIVLLLVVLGGCSARVRNPSTELTPRRALGVAVVEGWVYAAGGWNGEATQLGLVEVRNPHTGVWQKTAPLTIPRSQHALLAANGQLWAVAGWSATTGLVSAVERLSPCHPVTPSPCQTWQIITHLPTPRREPGVALWAGQIVVAGGFDGSSDADLDGYSDRVESYDLAQGQWRRLAALQVPRRGLVLVNAQGRLFAIGGYTERGFSKTVEEYDPPTARWVIRNWPLTPRTWAANAVVDGDILLVGGYNLAGFLNLVERIDPQRGQVCYPSPLQVARSWFALAPLEPGVLALGGETTAGFSGSVEWVQTRCQ